MCLCYSVIPHVERVLDDAADHLRRETSVGEFRDEYRCDIVEVAVLVLFYAARGSELRDEQSLCSLLKASGPGRRGDYSQEMVCDQEARLVGEKSPVATRSSLITKLHSGFAC